jgi:predicted HTH transcriptional regulator
VGLEVGDLRVTDEDFAELIDLGHETRKVEFKAPGRSEDGHTFAVIARAMMAMANLRGGGYVVIGVEERVDKTLDPVGVPDLVEYGWTDYDRLCGRLSAYCEPSVCFEVEACTYHGRTFALIVVDEFSDVPVVCKSGHTSQADPARGRPRAVEVLQAGRCYVRPKRKPESVPVSSAEDMRELIELATEKAVARYAALRRIEGANAPESAAESDTQRYDRELEGLA